MSLLETSQIIFNLIVSLAVILITALISIIAYDIIKFSKSFKALIDNINKESSELYEKINKFLENLFNLSFISKFFNKKNKKGRSK